MTEQQRMEIEVGMRVMVKVASREIPATVVEVGESWFLVRSDSTGREFKTNRVVDILDAPETEDAEIAQAAADIADEEAATAELRSREENGEAADEAAPAEEPAAHPKPAKATKGKDAKAAKGKGKAKKAEEPPRRLSLANAAVEVLRQENKPLNTRELVKLATERGLWTPTACRTPEQSLYGAFFLEIKNSDSPRIKKSAERGKFELA